MTISDISSFLACLPVAALLIWVAPKLDGDATREINRIEAEAAEAQGWLDLMGVGK